MKKNIAIVALAVALAICLLQSVLRSADLALHISAARAAQREVRLAGFRVWSQACQHAAAGSAARWKWCEWAASQTTVKAADEGVSPEDYASLALEKYVTEQSARLGNR